MEVRPWGGRGWPEVGYGADGWGPPASCWEGRGVLGRVGRKDWAAAGMVGWARGGKLDRFVFFSFSFFQTHF
jgi:hypothetical protein